MSAGRSEAILKRLELFGIRLGLERIRRMLDALGDPHLAVPVVLVAGTNGKGSVSALLAAMSRAAELRTGLYTSPHLETVTERLLLDGRPIDDDRLAGYLERILGLAETLGSEPPTYFEALTTAAFLYFRDAAAELAVMEVGLGGRLDATNVSEPELSLITSISLDHESHLGVTTASVAREKCGILRQGKPAVAWAGSQEMEQVLRAQANAAGAALVFADRVEVETETPGHECPQRALLRSRDVYEMELPLAGKHQLDNLCVAVLAAEILGQAGQPALDSAAIVSGTASCRWPGRLEWIDLGDGRRVLLDAAHNAAGLEALVGYLEQLGERPALLFGAMADKTIDALLPRLGSAVSSIVVTRPPGERAADPDRWLPRFEGRPAGAEADLGRALEKALAATDGTLLVCGSIYLVGKARKLLRERFGVPAQGSPS